MAQKKSRLSSRIDTLRQALMLVKICRVILLIYTFLCFLFWILNCLEVDWLYKFNALFILPYKFVSTFYKVQGVSTDFSLVIIGIITLVLAFSLNSVSEAITNKIVELEEQLENQRERRKRQLKAHKISNPVLGNDSVPESNSVMPTVEPLETEPPKLVFIITNHIHRIKRQSTDLELTFQQVEVWNQRVNKRLIENFNSSQPIQKGYYRKNLFLVYKEFNQTDNIIYYINPTLDSIIMEFKKYGIEISFSYVLSSISNSKELEKELDCMDTVLSLNFINEPVVTQRFKINYDKKANPMYYVQLRGEYNLSKNLTISNRQSLYTLIKKQQGE